MEELLVKAEKKAAQIQKFIGHDINDMDNEARAKLSKKEAEQLTKWEKEREAILAELQATKEKLEEKEREEAAVDGAKKAKQARKAEELEARSFMSDAGAELLVDLKMKYESKFNNNSDKVESVWEHLHADFIAAVRDGRLPPGDERSLASLKTR